MTSWTFEDVEGHESPIKRPISDDGRVGHDARGNLMAAEVKRNGSDLRPYIEYRPIDDVRDKTCIICARGWELNGPAMMDQHRWDVSGSTVHQSCLARYFGIRSLQLYWTAIVEARIRFHGLKAVPNRYWGPNDDWGKHQPWYEAEMIDHPVKIVVGARKRVDSIEFRAQGGVPFTWLDAAKEAFKAEDVTKVFEPTSVLVHAWNDTKVKEYIKLLAGVSGYAKPSGGL